MPDDPLDLTSLDPRRDPAHWQAMVHAVTERVAPAMRERRARATSVPILIRDWARVALPLAAALAGLAVGLSRLQPAPTQVAVSGMDPVQQWVAGDLAIPAWLHGGRPPTPADLLTASGGRP